MYEKKLIGETKKVLDQGFIQLVDYMGTDDSILEAARVSFGNEELYRELTNMAASEVFDVDVSDVKIHQSGLQLDFIHSMGVITILSSSKKSLEFSAKFEEFCSNQKVKDEALLRLLMRHNHGTPFEMCVVKFRVQVPMDCWRQWIRHRTASVNEYSTRYTEAIDACQTTAPDQWRLQAKDNKQGSSGFLTKWPDEGVFEFPEGHSCDNYSSPGGYLSRQEQTLHEICRAVYEERLRAGIAKEQARKDLPLSTYTRAFWLCNLRNIFHFLELRMDSHAQLEIRLFANAMAEFIKELYPVAYKAFEDYSLNAKKFSSIEMDFIRRIRPFINYEDKPESMTKREWDEFLKKLS